MKLYKSMKAGLKSAHGDIKWKVDKWYKETGDIIACQNGFHASKNIIDAMNFVACEILCEVEVKGKSDIGNDKECWEQMRIKKAYIWDKTASVRLGIFAAELVINVYEKKYPKDKRPRKAIEAAKTYLKNPTEKNREAAAEAARAAEAAAEAAAWAARAAAWAARAAARAAAWAARAAEAVALEKCHDYVVKEIIPTLKQYED